MGDMSVPTVVVPCEVEAEVNIDMLPDKKEATVDFPTPVFPTTEVIVSQVLNSGDCSVSPSRCRPASAKKPFALLESSSGLTQSSHKEAILDSDPGTQTMTRPVQGKSGLTRVVMFSRQ